MQEGNILGLVRGGKFYPVKKESVNITEMSMAAGAEITAMNLDKYEGKVIRVSGHDAGDNWIYSAKIEDVH
jgi:hypothetical protein